MRTTGQEFATELITLFHQNAVYFWGLSYDPTSVNSPCPVRIFLSSNTRTFWNKITLQFTPNLTLPSAAQGYKLQCEIATVRHVSDQTIYTNVPAINSTGIRCYSEDGAIACENLGRLLANQTRQLRFAFVVGYNEYTSAPTTFYQDFGKMTIFHMDTALSNQ